MSTKMCTSIEQSKKLLNLGLDPSTADMYYSYYGNSRYNPTIAYKGQQWFLCQIRNSLHDDIPCWSLTALLELMPLFIRTDNGDYNFSLARGGAGAYTFSYIHSLKEPWELGYNLRLTTHKDSVIDAAFEMICWLIEQGHIKVNK